MNWFVDDFDYRCNSDDSSELMNNVGFISSLPPLVRDLMESADFFVILGDYVDPNIIEDYRGPDGMFDQPFEVVQELATLHNWPIKTIRRRFPEFQQHLLHEDRDPEDIECDEIERDEESEDALDHADSIDFAPPKAVFDLVEDLRNDYSADWFPYPIDKSLKGYASNLLKAVKRGIGAKALYNAVAEAKKRGAISSRQAARLWELHSLMAFQQDPEQYRLRIERRKARAKK